MKKTKATNGRSSNYIEKYIEFQELKINAQTELDLLLAYQSTLVPSYDREKAMELEVRIVGVRTYIGRIDEIIKQWGNALAALGQTYNKTEYELFNLLIIKGVPPKKITNWALQTCYNYRTKFYRDLRRLRSKTNDENLPV